MTPEDQALAAPPSTDGPRGCVPGPTRKAITPTPVVQRSPPLLRLGPTTWRLSGSVLLFETLHPLDLPLSHELRLRPLGQREEERGVDVTNRSNFPALLQRFLC